MHGARRVRVQCPSSVIVSIFHSIHFIRTVGNTLQKRTNNTLKKRNNTLKKGMPE